MDIKTALRKATTLLGVERIEPSLAFWKKLGLLPTTEVPDMQSDDGRLAFAILASDGFEIMYQTFASIKEDLWSAASAKEAIPTSLQRSVLYVEVTRLQDVEEQLRGERVVMPRRTTFYGSTEIGFADPAGHVIIFSEHQA